MLISKYAEHKRDFPEYYDNFCIHNNIRMVMDFIGVEKVDNYIDTTSGVSMPKVGIEEFNLIYNINTSGVLEPYDEKMHISLSDRSDDKAWNDIKKCINNGIPIVVLIDVFYLEHLPYYKNAHGVHSVVIYGYTDDERYVEIVDWYKPYFYIGRISIDDLKCGMASKNPFGELINSGYPIRNKWIHIEPSGWNATSQELLYKTVEKQLKTFYLAELEDENFYYGFGILNRIKEILTELTDYPQTELKNICERLHKKIFLMYKYSDFNFNYMKKIFEELKMTEFQQELNVLNSRTEYWRKFLNLLIKTVVADTDVLYKKVMSQYDKVLHFENEVFSTYDKILNHI